MHRLQRMPDAASGLSENRRRKKRHDRDLDDGDFCVELYGSGRSFPPGRRRRLFLYSRKILAGGIAHEPF